MPADPLSIVYNILLSKFIIIKIQQMLKDSYVF